MTNVVRMVPPGRVDAGRRARWDRHDRLEAWAYGVVFSLAAAGSVALLIYSLFKIVEGWL